MAYFKINDIDFSKYVSELIVGKEAKYNAQTNAAGNTVVDYIVSKREVEVRIITLDANIAKEILREVDKFNVTISFLNPVTNALVENVNCIIPDDEVEYYTIQANKVMLKEFKLKFSEL